MYGSIENDVSVIFFQFLLETKFRDLVYFGLVELVYKIAKIALKLLISLLRNQNVNKIFTDHCIFLLWQYEVTSSGKKCETFDFQ